MKLRFTCLSTGMMLAMGTAAYAGNGEFRAQALAYDSYLLPVMVAIQPAKNADMSKVQDAQGL
jgi:hypothetical protein